MCYHKGMYQKLFTLQEEVFKVLANQKRLEIIQLLGDQELSVSEMTHMLGIPQANVSQHLSLLRQNKIVLSRRDGHIIYYRLGDPRISEACALIKEVLLAGHLLTVQERQLMSGEESPYPIVKDVVCGMRISVAQAGGTTTHEEEHYYFCASGCQEKFELSPQRYAKKEVVRG